MTSTVAKSIHCCAALAVALLAVGCGDESPPEVADLTLREMLGMSPERVGEMSGSERAAMVDAIEGAWADAIERPPEPVELEVEVAPIAADQPSSPPLAFVRAFDTRRLSAGLDVQVSARVDAAGVRAEIRATPMPGEVLGLDFDGQDGLVAVAPLASDEARFDGPIYWDDAFGAVDVPELDGRTELEQARRLEPALRRYLYQMGLVDESARVVRAERAPMVLWYATGHRSVFVNPNLLHLLESTAAEPGARQGVRDTGGEFVTVGQPLMPAYIESCVAEQQRRCSQCFGSAGDPTSSVCNSLFAVPAGSDPVEHARQECDALADDAGAGFELYCYHQELTSNLGCFYSRDVLSECGAEGVPLSSVAALDQLGPMRDDSRPCQNYLTECRDGRVTDPPPDDPPPTADDTDSAAGDIESFGDCVAATCEILGAASCDSGGDGGDSGGGICEGDGLDGGSSCGDGLCAGDGDDSGDDESGEESTATASIMSAGQLRSTGLILGMPGLFLLGLAWWARRRELELAGAVCVSDEAPNCATGPGAGDACSADA